MMSYSAHGNNFILRRIYYLRLNYISSPCPFPLFWIERNIRFFYTGEKKILDWFSQACSICRCFHAGFCDYSVLLKQTTRWQYQFKRFQKVQLKFSSKIEHQAVGFIQVKTLNFLACKIVLI